MITFRGRSCIQVLKGGLEMAKMFNSSVSRLCVGICMATALVFCSCKSQEPIYELGSVYGTNMPCPTKKNLRKQKRRQARGLRTVPQPTKDTLPEQVNNAYMNTRPSPQGINE